VLKTRRKGPGDENSQTWLLILNLPMNYKDILVEYSHIVARCDNLGEQVKVTMRKILECTGITLDLCKAVHIARKNSHWFSLLDLQVAKTILSAIRVKVYTENMPVDL